MRWIQSARTFFVVVLRSYEAPTTLPAPPICHWGADRSLPFRFVRQHIAIDSRAHVRSRFSGRHLCIPSFPLKEFFFSGPFGKVGSGGQPPEPAGRFSLYKCCFHGEPVKTEEQAKVHFFALSLSPPRVEDKARWSACPRGRWGSLCGEASWLFNMSDRLCGVCLF